jgi:signal transduction histidine kinase
MPALPSAKAMFMFAEGGLSALLRTTTFRLAVAQAVVVLLFILALLVYVYTVTAGQLLADADAAADQEYAALEQAYAEGGKRRLEQEVVARAARDGPMLYVLAEADGAIVTGDFPTLPDYLQLSPTASVPERVDLAVPRAEAGGDETRDGTSRARGRAGRLLGGPILLVARDLGDGAKIIGRITQALWTVAGLGVAISILSGLLASWQAARRADALSHTAQDVMAGDLSRRAPVRGVGDEFDALAENFNAMLERIERLVHTTRTAGDAIAHDLRSPLARFRQKLETALDAQPNLENDRAALRKAALEADKILDMFEAVLKLSRLENAASWKFERVDVTRIMRELAEFYEPAAEEQGLGFSARIADGLALRGDAGLVTQAVSNLIENAMKYTPAGGRVEMRAERRADGRVEVCIADNGPGVPLSERERVTERFVRLEAARTSPGVGLGLALVSAVARLHQGGLHLRDGIGPSDRPGLGAALVLPALPKGA